MNKLSARVIMYGLVGLASILLSSIGYLYGHKLLSAQDLIGVFSNLWQVLVAFLIIATAGGIGEWLLRHSDVSGLIRFGLAAALGMIVMSVGILVLGATLGTNLIPLGIPILIVLTTVRKYILTWLKNLTELRTSIHGKYEKTLAAGAIIILCANLAVALAPPTEWDALVYHFAIPSAYLQNGRITYLANTMFWGMPELTEMIYLPAMRIAGVEAAAVIGVFVGAVVLLGLLGYVKSKFNNIAAWTAVAALLAGGSLGWSLSTGYVDWMGLLFGWSALAALNDWLERHDRRMLILTGIFCGGAIGTKYSAGVVLIGSILVLGLMQKHQAWKYIISSIFVLGLTATITSSPWWIKNFLATGNPFYPFFIPSGAMDQIRLNFYEKLPAWRNWQSVILLPWQATFLGIGGKEGYSADIGPLLVGLSPLAWINWKSRSEAQRTTILTAGIITAAGFVLWAMGSRISGLLIQTRLFFIFFPAWAVLAGAGIDAIWNLKFSNIRFGFLIGVLTILMFGLNVFSLGKSFVSRNPALYILRLEDEQTYLLRNLGSYTRAMETIQGLPSNSHVLMLWEARGYYCQPRCDSDEIIDRWFHDSTKYTTSLSILQTWHNQGFTYMLINNQGKDFVRENDPAGKMINWSLLDTTLANLTIEKEIDGGVYTLYRLP